MDPTHILPLSLVALETRNREKAEAKLCHQADHYRSNLPPISLPILDFPNHVPTPPLLQVSLPLEGSKALDNLGVPTH